MASKKNITLEFILGLPGSGKTTLSEELESKNRVANRVVHFDAEFDTCWWKKGSESEKAAILRNCISNKIKSNSVKNVILDGLFLTHDDIVRVVKAVRGYFSCINIVIHQYNEDRETCVKNDGGRRDVSSTNTILHAEYEQIDKVKLEEALKEKGIEHAHVVGIHKYKVQLKPDWERYFRGKADVWADGKIRSDKWCIGGSYGSCFGDGLSPVTPDDQPDFEALDELLAEICPNVTFLQYKKIMRECVEIEESYDSDYYGGGCSYNRYVCDIKKLYEVLKTFGYCVDSD